MKFINALVVKVKDEIIKFEDVELNLPNEVTGEVEFNMKGKEKTKNRTIS